MGGSFLKFGFRESIVSERCLSNLIRRFLDWYVFNVSVVYVSKLNFKLEVVFVYVFYFRKWNLRIININS